MVESASPVPRPAAGSQKAPHTRESLIAALRGLAASGSGAHVTRGEFARRTGIREHHYVRHFGGYSAFVEAAGLAPYTANKRISDDDLLGALRDSWLKAGGPVPRMLYDRTSPYRIQIYKRRWGKWPAVLAVFRDWLKRHDPDFPYLPVVAEQRLIELKRPPRRPPGQKNRPCGGVIHFRGCLHAPTCEQGVVLLFGMVAEELGFLVESVSPAFPDCEAKRRLPDGRWERLRIEFEMESRNFRTHGHDETQCDLIVCWENDWPECPLEVLELKKEIEKLRSA